MVLIIFILELTMNLYGYGFNTYFRDRWLLFDAIIIVVSALLIIIELILYDNLDQTYSNIASVLKGIFRFFRVFLVIRKASTFKKLKANSSI